MIRDFCCRVGMALSSGLGYVNFMNGWWEDWRVRCGWMYYTEKCRKYRLFRSKIPAVYLVNKSAVFYL